MTARRRPTATPVVSRARDRESLRMLAACLEQRASIPDNLAVEWIAAIKRYLRDEYPRIGHRRSMTERNFWIAVDYWTRRDRDRQNDKAAAGEISERCATVGIEIAARRVTRIGTEFHKRVASQIAYQRRIYNGFPRDYAYQLAQTGAEEMWRLAQFELVEDLPTDRKARVRMREKR